jgi:hypothetical protein
MADDATRKLLKVFGVSVTDCEDALVELRGRLSGAGGKEEVAAALEKYTRAARELTARWAEVSRLVSEYHLRAEEALAEHLRPQHRG